MSQRDIRRLVGQLVFVGFDGFTIPDDVRALAREFDLGGVILFSRNVEAPEQVAELAHDVQSLAREWPLWVAVDQEGGRVARLRRPFTEWPPAAVLGRSDDVELATRFARAAAEELRAVGVTFDFAPVLDVATNPSNPVIGDRALADRPETVAALGTAIVRAFQAAGVAACGKHFPGHGDTSVDSHKALPLVEHSPDRLRAVEWAPFRAAIAADVAAIMTAHILAVSLDNEQPATLSRRIITDVLRDELGFDGLILTDDLFMDAITARQTPASAAVAAIAAGCDNALLCSPQPAAQAAALEGLVYAVEAGAGPAKGDRAGIPMRQIEDSLARVRKAKERFLADAARWKPPHPAALRAVLGSEAHQRVADEMSRWL